MAVRGDWVWENKFQTAYKIMATKRGLSSDPDDPEHFYDYRTLYKETGTLEPDTIGRFPSKYKLEGYPKMVVDDVDTKTDEPVEKIGKIGKISSHEEQLKISSLTPTDSIEGFTNIKSKIDYYQEKIVWLEGIAEEKGGLGSSGYDAYRYAVSQYNVFVDEYNAGMPEEISTQKKRTPRAMQRTGVTQRQRGIGEVPEYELDTEKMPASVKLVDDWMQGAAKGIPLGIAGFASSFAELVTEAGRTNVLIADPEKFVGDPKFEGADEKFFVKMYGGDRFAETRGKVGAFASEQGQKIVAQTEEWSKEFLPAEDASEVEKFSADLHAGLVSLGGAVGLAVATQSTTLPAMVFGLVARGSTYGAAIEAGVPTLKASALGGIHQVTETITEFIGLEFLLTKLPVSKVLSTLFKAASEGTQEYIQGWFGNLVEKYGWNEAKDINEGLKREATIGFILGGGASIVIDSISDTYKVDPEDIAREIEATYQATLNMTRDIDFQDIIDSTQDYKMDVEPTATEKYDKFLDQSTEEILDQIDEKYIEEEIPEQYTEESDVIVERAEEERIAEVKEYELPKEIKTDRLYITTVYRGAREGALPTDEGLFGKGTYYTTNRDYAKTYGETKPSVVNLKKPFVIETQKEADAFWNETTRPARKEAIEEGKTPKEADEIAAKAARDYLEDKGHDGLIARDIIEEGDEIVVFHPESNIEKYAFPRGDITAKEGEATDLTVSDVGTPALAEYGLQVQEGAEIAPPLPPKERKEWEPVGLPPMKPSVAENLTYKEPVLSKWYTPKMELMRQIGTEKILGNLPEASGLMEMKATDLTHEVNELIKKLNKDRGIKERFGTWIKNKPSEQVANLRDLLNTYEKAPDFLTFEEKTLFNQARDLTRDLLKITNEFRKAAGLTEINNLEAYVPHFLDEIARAAANGMYPYVADVYRWTGKKPPKKGTNPTARQRTVTKLTDDLNEVFSKDLGKLLKAMIKYDLRDIYLAIPYAQVRANIDSLKGQIPTKVLQELEEYIEFDIFDHQTDLDKIINLTVDRVGITKAVNFLLKPFGRVMTDPVRLLSSTYRQGLMGGAIAGKPRIVLRNLFQRMLTLDFVAPTDFVKAQFYAPTWQMDKIRDTYFYKKSVQNFEDLPPLLKPIQWGMYPFQKSHAGMIYLSNIDVAMRAGWWSGQRRIDWCQSDKGQAYIKDFIAKRPWMTEQQKEDAISRDGDQTIEAVEVGSYTQWAYFSQEMPRVFRGQGARAFWSLQSWMMNYFGKHVPEMCRRTFKGVTGKGRIVSPSERWRAAKGLATIFAILTALKKATGIDMVRFAFFPFPSILAPHLGQLLYNTYKFFLALTDPEEREGAWSKLKSSLRLLLPFSGAVRRYVQMLRGDITMKEWLFYMEHNDDWKQIWIKNRKKAPSKEIITGKIGERPEKIGAEIKKIGERPKKIGR